MSALSVLTAAPAVHLSGGAADGPAGLVQVHVGGRSHRKVAGQGQHSRRLISPHGEADDARTHMDVVSAAISPRWRRSAGSHRCHLTVHDLAGHGRLRRPPFPERIDWWLQVWDASVLHALDLFPGRIT